MKDKYIIIVILILIAILFLYKYQENISTDSGKTLSDEALQNIASIYNTQNMTVTNLNASNQANIKDAKISNNLDVTGNINSKIINAEKINTGSIDSSGNINASKNITTNNKGMVTWRQLYPGGTPQKIQAKDPNGTVYNADDWFVYASGWGVANIGGCQAYIDSTSKTWFLYIWAPNNITTNSIDVLAIPKGYFSNVFTSTYSS